VSQWLLMATNGAPNAASCDDSIIEMPAKRRKGRQSKGKETEGCLLNMTTDLQPRGTFFLHPFVR